MRPRPAGIRAVGNRTYGKAGIGDPLCFFALGDEGAQQHRIGVGGDAVFAQSRGEEHPLHRCQRQRRRIGVQGDIPLQQISKVAPAHSPKYSLPAGNRMRSVSK